jgi:hypothetical protein
MKPVLFGIVILVLSGCDDRHKPRTSKAVCYQDSEGLVWTNKRLMNSYISRREQINGSNLCYPYVGLTSDEIERGRKCPHPRQRLLDGRCHCVPYPDVLFTKDDISRWCIEVRETR